MGGKLLFLELSINLFPTEPDAAATKCQFADKGLKLVSITCDPGVDTPVVLSGYANRFNADPDNWKFLSPADGNAQYLSRIGNEMLGSQ